MTLIEQLTAALSDDIFRGPLDLDSLRRSLLAALTPVVESWEHDHSDWLEDRALLAEVSGPLTNEELASVEALRAKMLRTVEEYDIVKAVERAERAEADLDASIAREQALRENFRDLLTAAMLLPTQLDDRFEVMRKAVARAEAALAPPATPDCAECKSAIDTYRETRCGNVYAGHTCTLDLGHQGRHQQRAPLAEWEEWTTAAHQQVDTREHKCYRCGDLTLLGTAWCQKCLDNAAEQRRKPTPRTPLPPSKKFPLTPRMRRTRS